MKTEFLSSLGLEKDIIDKIMAENGKDIEAEKAKNNALKSENDTFKTKIQSLEEKITELNDAASSNADYKLQLEKLLDADNVGTTNSEVRYSIVHSDKLGDIAFLDKDLIKKNDNESYNQAIKNFFNDNFKNREIEILENKETVNLDQIGKYLHPGSKVENYKEKQVASQILDDIIRIAKNKTHNEDLMVDGKKKEHSGLNADNGWDYYDTQFAIDESGIIYGGVIIVRKSKNGKNYFYDIDKIREVGYQDVKEFNPVKYGRTSLKDNITQLENIINNDRIGIAK